MYKPFYAIVAFCALSISSFAQSQDNEVFIKQVGTNTANVTQAERDGLVKNSLVDVYQVGSGNYTGIVQGTEGTSEGDEAFLQQTGNDNSAEINQGFVFQAQARDNEATVQQQGQGNLAKLGQAINGGNARNNEALIGQEGIRNNATISQGEFSGILLLKIVKPLFFSKAKITHRTFLKDSKSVPLSVKKLLFSKKEIATTLELVNRAALMPLPRITKPASTNKEKPTMRRLTKETLVEKYLTTTREPFSSKGLGI